MMQGLICGNTISNFSGATFFMIGLLVFCLAFFVAACYLEVRLSKAEEWWKVLIPLAVLLVVGAFSSPLGVILLVIYGVNRYQIKKQKDELEQMKIKDL